MDFSYQEDSKSSSDELDRNDDEGTGRSYECVFCKRGFTTAQALGGHMNIHRKDRANKNKPSNFPPPSSSKIDDGHDNYVGFYPSHLARGNNNYFPTTIPDREVDAMFNYHQFYFPSDACGTRPNEVLGVENHHHLLFGQDWRKGGLSLYTNIELCVQENKDKIGNNSEEDELDLELRL